MHSQGILGADVNQSLVGPDAITADGHCLKHRVGVALHDGAVHECAGVALVGIAHHILVFGLVVAREAPFQACGEAGATASAQTGLLDDVDHLLGGLVLQGVGQCGVAVAGDVLLDVLGVDKAAVAQCHTQLFAIEVHVLRVAHGVLRLWIHIEQSLHLSAANHVLFDDFLGILGLHLGVEGVVGHDLHDGAFLAEAEAAGDDHVHLVGDSLSLDGRLEVVDNLRTVRGFATGAAAAQQLDVLGTHGKPATFFARCGVAQLTYVEFRLSFLPELGQVFKVQGFHWLISCLVIS